MTVGCIIEDLRELGIDVELGIKINSASKPSPEAEELLKKLSSMREEAIDHLLAGKIFPLPDNQPIPDEFRSERMNQIRPIFTTCYKLLEVHEGATTEDDWKAVYAFREGKLNEHDPLAVAMHTAAISELRRQSKLPQ